MELEQKKRRIQTLMGIAGVLFAGTIVKVIGKENEEGLEEAALAVQNVAIKMCEEMGIDWLSVPQNTPTQDELSEFASPDEYFR